jgi:hypothetical protein
MKYALLIYTDQESWTGLSDEEKARRRDEEMPNWIAVMEELRKADSGYTGYELDEAGTAKVVRVRDGERIVTDGPFAETKEVLGGAFVLEVDDLDEAIRLASLVPSSWHGSLEIRPILQ